MNVWMRDPRVEKAETDAFHAERAERAGDPAEGRALHHAAAEGFACVALSVPADHPNTRGDLAIAAVASFARAGDLGRAVEFARRILVERDALTEYGRAELGRLLAEYASLMSSHPQPAKASRGSSVRDEVRSSFGRAAAGSLGDREAA